MGRVEKVKERQCYYCQKEITEGEFFYDLKYKTMDDTGPRRLNDGLILAVHTVCFHSGLALHNEARERKVIEHEKRKSDRTF